MKIINCSKLFLLGLAIVISSGVLKPLHAQEDSQENLTQKAPMSYSGAEYAIKNKAKVILRSTVDESIVIGEGSVLELQRGVYFMIYVKDISPGPHGIHVHEFGSCEEQGKAAGGHLNPEGVKHGFFKEDGPKNAHPGDLGNIDVDDQGMGELHRLLPGLTLDEGIFNVAGKAIILHENEDDFSQPTGNAGGRIACGIIEVVKDQ
ncbi:MAG: superoxide dismutase family protein [Candidatus Omnitrophica bacterium]|nr:superoxide dismutase family protein [Candidatus Omnitrophota bacterium]